MIKVKHVTCGQDSRLPSWEMSLTHCACPPAKTLRSAPASFLPAEQGTLCLKSLASTWGCGEVNYYLRRYVSWWDKRPNRQEEGYDQSCNPLNPMILSCTQEASTLGLELGSAGEAYCTLWPNAHITIRTGQGWPT